MSDRCELKHHNGIDACCTEQECPFWRVVDHLHLASHTEGCAIQYFGLLGERGSEISRWLLSVKERVEAEEDRDADALPTAGRPDADGTSCSTW